MTIDDFNAFIYVANTENITTASKLLGITESGLSKTIRRIENELGCTLFKRVNNRIYLTDNGMYALEISRNIMDLWKKLNTISQPKTIKSIDIYSTDICLLQNMSFYVSELKTFSEHIIIDHLTSRLQAKNAIKNQICDFYISLEQMEDAPGYFSRNQIESFVIVARKGLFQTQSISLKEIKNKPLLSIDKKGPILHFFEAQANNYGIYLNIFYQIDTAIFHNKIYNASFPAILTKSAAQRLDTNLVDILDIEEEGFTFPVYITTKNKYHKHFN